MRLLTPLITLAAAVAVSGAPFSLDTSVLLNSDTLGQIWSFSKEMIAQAPTTMDGKEDKTIWAQLTDDPQYVSVFSSFYCRC
jgi:hypothetical protein